MASKIDIAGAQKRRAAALAEAAAELDRIGVGLTRDARRHGCAARVARKLLWESARRARVLPRIELHDPQWMMLLELFVAAEEDREVTVKTLCIVSHVPATTAARHIAHLERQGMVRRAPNPADGRSYHFALMPRVRERIRAYLDELDRDWLEPAPSLLPN